MATETLHATRAVWMLTGRVACLLAAIVLATAGGCGGGKKSAKSARGGGKSEEAAPAIDPASLMTVDGGRISVGSPTGWTRSPRSNDYLVRYQPGPQKSYPSIVVTGEDIDAAYQTITADNHDDFKEAMAEDLATTYTQNGKNTLLRKPAAVTIGRHKAVTWEAPGTAKFEGLKEPIIRSCIAIVVGGRLYRVETRAPKGKLDDKAWSSARAAARAVAAAIGPPSKDAPADEPAGFGSLPAADAGDKKPEPAKDDAAAEKPADKPAEKAGEGKAGDEPAAKSDKE
jgi:hypothetical protein